MSSPSLGQGAEGAQVGLTNPRQLRRKEATQKGREVSVRSLCVPAPARKESHPPLLDAPSRNKQETSAGLWIHSVNKYTEDIRAFKGNGVWA